MRGYKFDFPSIAVIYALSWLDAFIIVELFILEHIKQAPALLYHFTLSLLLWTIIQLSPFSQFFLFICSGFLQAEIE